VDKILYYPYINLPETGWTLRTLLYYDTVSSIVPKEYFNNPENNYDPFMLDLVRSELVIPIDPMQVLERSWEIAKPFLAFTKEEAFQAPSKAKLFEQGGFNGERIHEDKFAYQIFKELKHMDLAVRASGSWWIVEKSVAGYLMQYIATLLGSILKAQATTDSLDALLIPVVDGTSERNGKRETILKELIPFPQDIDLTKLRKFKDKHHILLHTFKNKIERIVLDHQFRKGLHCSKTR
jgi:hypothetical protein